MKSVIIFIAALAATIVSAQSSIVSITSPLAGTVYTTGQNAIIAWINPTVNVISKIVLSKGNPSALQPVGTIAQNVDANVGFYTWTIPSDIVAGDDYAFMLGTSPNLAFSGLFTIQSGSSSNATASSVPAASST